MMAARLRAPLGSLDLGDFLFQLPHLLLQAISHGCQFLDPRKQFKLRRR